MYNAARIALAAITLSAAGLTGCQTNPATGRSQFVMISSSQAAQLGDEAKPQLVQEYGGEIPNASVRQYVSQVGSALAARVEPEFDDIQWTFTVLDSDVINAFALPGGHVFISRGLLARFENEAQLAGVLGHEIGHVTGQHVDERISQSMAVELGLGALGQLTESQLLLLGAQLATGGYQLSFGRSQEIEADDLGLRYMVEAGYDPRGMLQVLDVLVEASQGGAPPEFLSTHPHPQTRIENVTRLIERNYQNTQNNPQYDLHRERFQQQAAPHLSAHEGSHPGALAIMMHAEGCSCGHH